MKGEDLKEIYQKLKRETKREKIEHLVHTGIKNRINYSPSYQRNYIWSSVKAIKLIETVLIYGEIPPITVVVYNNTYEIIDGRQRYETLLRFYQDEFPLRAFGLTVLKELDGLTYSKLPINVRTRFNEYRLKMITYTLPPWERLDMENLDLIKRNLFRKYNYGMTALNKSEVARAKYLYDELTISLIDYFTQNKEHYEMCIQLFLAVSKRQNNDREKMNLLLMNARELLSMPYIPIIGLKTVKCSNVIIEKYYEHFVLKENIQDKKQEFIKIAIKLYDIKVQLKNNQNSLQENILFFKSVYWMLSLLYKYYPNEFYNFKVNQFIHYVEGSNNASDYFFSYKSMSSDHIINRHQYVKKYVEEELNLNLQSHLEDILNNRFQVNYKPDKKLAADENWPGLGEKEQILTQDDIFTIGDIIHYIKENRFVVRPIYQRGEVRSIEKASKIIESMILGVKIPPIYVMVDKNENSLDEFIVIDGQQRLISILRFLGEEVTDENHNYIQTYKKNYPLKGLKDLEYLNDKTYDGKNRLNEKYQEIIQNYELDVIKIPRQANPEFDAVDMFLRLNENPCTIGKNCFEMWNSFDITNVIKKIKDIAKVELLKQNGNKMKEEELVTILAYLKYKGIHIDDCSEFFKIHLYTENRDRIDERIEVKLAIGNKNEITRFLETMRPNTSLEKEFLDCLDYVQLFIEKLNLLCDYDYEKLLKIFNPYLSVARKGSMKDFYVMFLIFEYFDNHIIKTYKLEILNDLGSIFKLMKNMPTHTDASFFMENIKSFIEKYQK